MKPRFAKHPSQRAIHNQLQGLAALHKGVTPHFKAAPAERQAKPRAQREAGASDAIKDWRIARGDVRLWRNNVGFYRDGERAIRYGLCPGSADFVGLRSVVVTPAMVGKRIAVFLAVETKAPGKDADSHQATWLDEVANAGAIAGVARSAQEADELVRCWDTRIAGDER